MQYVLDNLNMIITIALFSVMGIIALWCMITGLKRGTIRSTIRLLTVVASAALAIFAVSAVGTTVLPMVEPSIKAFVVNTVTGLSAEAADVINASEDLVNYLVEILMALVMPVLFMLLFLGFMLLTLPVYWILKLFVPKRDGIRFISRVTGAAVSVVSAALICLCVMMPVTGYATYAVEAYPAVMETGLVPEGTVPETVDVQVEACKNNLAVTTVNKCGGGILFNIMTKVGETQVTDEIDYVIETAGVTWPAIQQLIEDNAHMAEAETVQPLNLTALKDTILPQLEKSPIRLRGIMAEILRVGAEKWTNDETFAGVNLGEMLGTEIAGSVNILLEEITATQGETVVSDLRSFSVTAEDLTQCLSYFEDISAANPNDLVSTGKKTLDLSVIRDKVLPMIDTSEEAVVERAFLADVMKNAAIHWKRGENYLGIEMKKILGNYQSSGDLLLDRLINSDGDHIVADLNAVSRDMEVLSQTYVYFVNVQDSSKNTEELKTDLTQIVQDMTPEAVEVIKSTLTEEITNTVEIKEGSDAVVELIGTAFENVTAMPVEDRAQEAEALNQVLNYATGNRTEEVTENAVVDAMLGSTAISNTIIETVEKNNDPETAEEDKTQITIDESQKAQLDSAIDDRLANDTELTEEQRNMLAALKDLFITTGSDTEADA